MVKKTNEMLVIISRDIQRKINNIVILLHKPHMCLRLAQDMKFCALCLREYNGSNERMRRGDLGMKVWTGDLQEDFKYDWKQSN